MLYFDNASTTKISKEALDTYIKASENFYNPSALYNEAGLVKRDIDNTREFFVKLLKGKPKSTFIFTAGATEANNAVLNSCFNRKDKKYIFSAGEHSSIYETALHYKEQGYDVKFVPLNPNGSVNVEELMKLIDKNVALVSIIHVSNETGAVNDIENIARKIKNIDTKIIIHSDGVQAVGKININLSKMDVDFYTLSAHKINGPKGVGALFIANQNKFKPFLLGGGQESNLRSGTENTPGILSFKTAMANIKMNDYSEHKKALLSHLSGDYVVVSDESCVDNIISICFKGVRGETIAHMMESKGYLIGTGSACNSKAHHNRVISQLVDRDYIDGTLRISFSDVSIADCIRLGQELSQTVLEYRRKINR